LTEGEHDNDFDAYQINRNTKAYRNAAKSPVIASTPVTYLTYWNRLPAVCLRNIRGNPGFSLKLIQSFLLKKANGIVNLVEGPDDHDLDNYLARFRQEKRKIVSNESSEDDQKELSEDDSRNNAGQQEAKRQRCEELRIENAELSTQIEELQANAALVPIAIAPARLPNANGAHKPLVLNGLVIEVDPDTLMVNATQMCKAAGKRWNDYRENNKSNDYIFALESKTGIPVLDLIKSNRGGDHSGTMVHRLIAYDLASWLSGDVRLQFFMWNDELLLTGRVELGKEMNVQQLEESWRRINEEVKAKASEDLSAEQDRCQELELRLATIQEAHQRSDEEKKALVAIKTRQDLEAAIQFQARATAPTIASYTEGDNVLYLARVDGTKFKYGCSKNVGRRFETHGRPGVYPTFEPIGVLPCANAVASEDQVRAYVKKTKIGVEYGNQREVVVLESVDALQRMMKKMQKCCRQQPASEGSEVVLRRIEVKAGIKMKKIDSRVDMEKIKADVDIKKMDVDLEKKRMDVDEKNKEYKMKKLQMVIDGHINFDQFLLIK
jgi:hypothetical protein